MPLRYGENPHQQAALYIPGGPHADGIAQAEQVQGKELSYNNLNDANAALELVSEFRDGEPTVVIVKHANPCGVATRGSLIDAWTEALACDSVSAFGGIVATNRPLDAATAEAISQIFTEVVVAPDADDEAQAIFAKKKNLRLLLTGELPDPARPEPAPDGRSPAACWSRTATMALITRDQLKCVTKRQPTRAGTGRLPVRLDRRQARQVERHRLCEGRRHRRHRRRPDEPPRQRPDRRHARPRSGRSGRLAGAADRRLGGRLRRLLPVRRRTAVSRGSGRDGGDPAGRLDPRRAKSSPPPTRPGLAMLFTGMRHFRH